MSSADLPDHPILNGVSVFNGGENGNYYSSVPLAADALLVAHWDGTSTPLVATLRPTTGISVGLNVYPGSSDYASTRWDSSTDGATLMANILIYAAGESDGDGDGYTPDDGDCDDNDPATNPGAEDCADGIDNDCDELVDADDPDCSGDDDDATDDDDSGPDDDDVAPDDDDSATDDDDDCIDCDGDGYSASVDCDDASSAIFPGAEETANGLDDDCDGEVDEGTSTGGCDCGGQGALLPLVLLTGLRLRRRRRDSLQEEELPANTHSLSSAPPSSPETARPSRPRLRRQ